MAHSGSITTILEVVVETLLSFFLIPVISILPPDDVALPIIFDLGVPCSMLDIISLPPEIDTSKSEFENTPPTVNGISHFKPLSTVNRFLSNNTKKSAFCPSSGTGTIAASKSLVILKAPSLLTFLLMLSSIFFAMLSLPNMTVQSSIVDDEMFGRKPISRLTSNLLF